MKDGVSHAKGGSMRSAPLLLAASVGLCAGVAGFAFGAGFGAIEVIERIGPVVDAHADAQSARHRQALQDLGLPCLVRSSDLAAFEFTRPLPAAQPERER